MLLVAAEAGLERMRLSLERQFIVSAAAAPRQAIELLVTINDVTLIVIDEELGAANAIEVFSAGRAHAPSARRVVVSRTQLVPDNFGEPHHIARHAMDGEELRLLQTLARAASVDADRDRAMEQLERDNEDLRARQRVLSQLLEDRQRDLSSAHDDLERVSADLAISAFRDPLTQLYNHRTIQERLREEMARARRYSKPLSLLIADIDHFRALNDQYGHTVGDEILRRVAEVFAADGDGRESDIVARFGGEEFAVLLPETSKAGAKIKAERLVESVREQVHVGGKPVTLSLGLAGFPDEARTPDELVAMATRALDVSKQAGRNQVQVFGEGLAAPGAQVPGSRDRPAFAAGPELPSYHERIFAISTALERERALGCLFIDLSRLRRIELEYGIGRHNELLARVAKMLVELRGERVRATDLMCRADDGDAFVTFLAASRRSGEQAPEALEALALRVQDALNAAFSRELFDMLHDHPRIVVGYARVLHNPMVRSERLITRLVEEARGSATLVLKRQGQRDKDLLQEIILGDGLTPVYQPIVHLDTGEIFGFEALTRGPHRSPLEAPLALFGVAEQVDLLFELDRACFRGALRGALGLEPVHRLFVNLLPLSFYDSSFIEDEVSQLLTAANLTPANVVFEITERLAIENFTSFKRALAVFTGMGFGVAIDDVGTKHSNLEAVMSLRPHFVKLSDVLTRGVAKSTVKREMLRSLGRISEAIDAVMVAEGIETPEDLMVLEDLGIKYGQGYFLARPGAAFPKLRASIKRAVRALASRTNEPTPTPPAQDYDEDGEPHEHSRNSIVLPERTRVLLADDSEDGPAEAAVPVVEDAGDAEPDVN